MSHGHARLGVSTPQSVHYAQGRFGRLFPALPPFADDTAKVRDGLMELGAKSGPMNAGDDLCDPITLITDPAKSADNPDNPALTAGFTFLGQFIDHDMTFDPTSSLSASRIRSRSATSACPRSTSTTSTAAARGPRRTSTTPRTPDKLLVEEIPGSAAVSHRRPATASTSRATARSTALIGDPRNDENLIVSQLQLAFLRFHNHVVDDVTAEFGSGYTRGEIFREAQRRVRWHYQWIVAARVPASRRWASRSSARSWSTGRSTTSGATTRYIPVEFSVGAYRFGHSQVRPSYRANFGTSATDATQQFFALFTDHTLPAADDPDDLRGGKRAPRRFIDWQTFFDFGDDRVRRNKRIDTKLSSILFDLLGQPADESHSLAPRNLIRALDDEGAVRPARRQGHGPAPLPRATWTISSRSTSSTARRCGSTSCARREVFEDGQRLGPVGGRIVAEVIIGLITGTATPTCARTPLEAVLRPQRRVHDGRPAEGRRRRRGPLGRITILARMRGST